ncbi:hypothetical protein HB364_07640 [Pseudoflavitalea sp. X16]|uniref:hypothetical protein n=1 Tax=Paraflavitalea devenefica TaxID=2716334 RepID=UPI001420B51F|nr:hypothetical protein [Paraflavitalea devenefica]NII24945.1 hypothetical protein [Paraflavitalea devenefica]
MRINVLLIILTSSPFLMNAQTITLQDAEAYAAQLEQKEILNTKGKEVLLNAFHHKNVTSDDQEDLKMYHASRLSKETILWFCNQAFFDSQMHRLLNQTGVEDKIVAEDAVIERGWTAYPPLGSRGNEDLIHPKRSTIGRTRTRTLEDFKVLGLISEMVYEEAKKGIQDATIDDELALVGFLLKRSYYYKSYDTELKKQQQHIDDLANKGILTKEKKEALLESYKPYELKDIAQILSYSERYRFVDLTRLEANPHITYPVIFQAVAALIPDFKYENLHIVIDRQKEDDMIRQDLKLSFTINGQLYEHVFFYDYVKVEPDPNYPEDPPARVSRDFHKGVNKWLADINSSYRLYTVNIPEEGEMVYGEKKVGLLLLKKGEAEVINKENYVLSHETFDVRLNRAGINKFIQDLTDHGFFAHLSNKEIDRTKASIFASDITSPLDVCMRIPHTVVIFDWETGNLRNPYEDLTKRFEKASRGVFSVTDIIDEFEKSWDSAKKVKYGFTMNGKKYETMLDFHGDWLDPKFIDLLRQAMKENKIDGEIRYCMDNGQEGGHIFLTSKQYAFIKKNYTDLIKDE